MTKASIDLQDLRRRLYVKAKAETSWRFWGLYVHVCKLETLRAAYALSQENDGAPGVDGVTFAAIRRRREVDRWSDARRAPCILRSAIGHSVKALAACHGSPNVAIRSIPHTNSTRFSSIFGSRRP